MGDHNLNIAAFFSNLPTMFMGQIEYFHLNTYIANKVQLKPFKNSIYSAHLGLIAVASKIKSLQIPKKFQYGRASVIRLCLVQSNLAVDQEWR